MEAALESIAARLDMIGYGLLGLLALGGVVGMIWFYWGWKNRDWLFRRWKQWKPASKNLAR